MRVEQSSNQCLPGEEEIWGGGPAWKRREHKQRPKGEKQLGCVRKKSSLAKIPCEDQGKGNYGWGFAQGTVVELESQGCLPHPLSER